MEALKLQNTKSEIVGHYDINDNYIGGVNRKEMRQKNLIHRATDIFVINSIKKILIQIRADTKEYCPGYYDLVFGGVVGDKEDMHESAVRELNEEIGINVKNHKDRIKFFGKKFHKEDISQSWDYFHYFLIKEDEEDKIYFNDGEVQSVQWKSKDEVIQLIEKERSKITCGSIGAFEELLKLDII